MYRLRPSVASGTVAWLVGSVGCPMSFARSWGARAVSAIAVATGAVGSPIRWCVPARGRMPSKYTVLRVGASGVRAVLPRRLAFRVRVNFVCLSKCTSFCACGTCVCVWVACGARCEGPVVCVCAPVGCVVWACGARALLFVV
jgi:hypothetical protein